MFLERSMSTLFKKIPSIWSKIIVAFLAVSSLSIAFPAGMINTNSQIEICSEFFATLTKSHTKGKTYSALNVGVKEGSSKELTDTSREFYDLYGSFRTDKACFANTVNLNKEKNIVFEQANLDYLSFLFTSSGLMLKYVENIGWRHEFYPLNMMFDAPKEERPYPPYRYCFISKSQADILLDSGFLDEPISKPYTESDYKKLQYKLVNFSCDGESLSYYILSIFYETGYYYEALKEIMGEFAFAFGVLPGGNLKRQATYFMRDYSFQNEHYINYAKEQYNESDFVYSVGTYNLIDDFASKVDVSALIFANYSNNYSILLFAFSVFLSLLTIAFVIFTKFGKHWTDIVVFVGAVFLPYLTFKIVSSVTESIRLFTGLSTQFNMVLSLVLLIIFTIVFIYKNARKKEVLNENE